MTCQVQIIAHDGSLVKARGLHPSQVSPIQFVAKFNTYTSSENISVSAIVVISTMWYGRRSGPSGSSVSLETIFGWVHT